MMAAGNFAPGDAGTVFHMDVICPVLAWPVLACPVLALLLLILRFRRRRGRPARQRLG